MSDYNLLVDGKMIPGDLMQAGQCADSSLSAVLVHNGEKMLRDRAALETWWNGVSGSHARAVTQVPTTVCEILK